MKWVGYAARMRDRRGLYRVLERRHDGKIPLEKPSHIGKIILKCNFKK